VPDVSPMTNALGWSFAIGFGCWIVMQLLEVVATFPQEAPADEPGLGEAPAGRDARH